MNPKIEAHRQIILEGKSKGRAATMLAYARLSGPGWLQSAITLGGGSLANSLYLGVLGGMAFLWLQPMAMVFGIVMMSAIAYVTLSTEKRPLREINKHISPVLGWGWLIASMMANLVWSMPQFALAVAAIRQNLLPGVLGPEAMPDEMGKTIAAVAVLLVVLVNVLIYNMGGRGVKIFEGLMQAMVGAIVLSFFGVVIRLVVAGQVDWGALFKGLVPTLSGLFKPAETFAPFLDALSEGGRLFWEDLIVRQQRDVIIGAAASAVGINMTFLLPYSMLRKGWGRDFRGLAIFDLSTGLLIPYVLATACVVIASSSQFHAQPAPGFLGETDERGALIEPAANLVGPFNGLLKQRLEADLGSDVFTALSEDQVESKIAEMPVAERSMAAMLVKRDAFNLAATLEPLVGSTIANYLFGIGILGMALSSCAMLMLVNGLCYCELVNKPASGRPQQIGSLMVCVGVLGPFLWSGDAKLWLAVPTSAFAMILLPIAYAVFALLMNNKTILGKDMPSGPMRIFWNVLMAGSCTFAAVGSIWLLWATLQWMGIVLFLAFIGIVVMTRKKPN